MFWVILPSFSSSPSDLCTSSTSIVYECGGLKTLERVEKQRTTQHHSERGAILGYGVNT